MTMKKGDIGQELDKADHAIEVLGGRLQNVREVDVDGLRDNRSLVVTEKIKPTRVKFPRRPGIPRKHPL